MLTINWAMWLYENCSALPLAEGVYKDGACWIFPGTHLFQVETCEGKAFWASGLRAGSIEMMMMMMLSKTKTTQSVVATAANPPTPPPWENVLLPSIKYAHAHKQASWLIEKEKINKSVNEFYINKISICCCKDSKVLNLSFATGFNPDSLTNTH